MTASCRVRTKLFDGEDAGAASFCWLLRHASADLCRYFAVRVEEPIAKYRRKPGSLSPDRCPVTAFLGSLGNRRQLEESRCRCAMRAKQFGTQK